MFNSANLAANSVALSSGTSNSIKCFFKFSFKILDVILEINGIHEAKEQKLLYILIR